MEGSSERNTLGSAITTRQRYLLGPEARSRHMDDLVFSSVLVCSKPIGRLFDQGTQTEESPQRGKKRQESDPGKPRKPRKKHSLPAASAHRDNTPKPPKVEKDAKEETPTRGNRPKGTDRKSPASGEKSDKVRSTAAETRRKSPERSSQSPDTADSAGTVQRAAVKAKDTKVQSQRGKPSGESNAEPPKTQRLSPAKEKAPGTVQSKSPKAVKDSPRKPQQKLPAVSSPEEKSTPRTRSSAKKRTIGKREGTSFPKLTPHRVRNHSQEQSLHALAPLTPTFPTRRSRKTLKGLAGEYEELMNQTLRFVSSPSDIHMAQGFPAL